MSYTLCLTGIIDIHNNDETDDTTPSFRVCTELGIRSNRREKVVTRCVMTHRGVSLQINTDTKPIDCIEVKHGFYHECDEAGVTMFGRFSRGEKTGPQWASTRGGGWLVAEVDTEDRARGEATFLYPDLVTAITGDFREGRLRSGRQGTLSGESSLLITHEIFSARREERVGDPCSRGLCAPWLPRDLL